MRGILLVGVALPLCLAGPLDAQIARGSQAASQPGSRVVAEMEFDTELETGVEAEAGTEAGAGAGAGAPTGVVPSPARPRRRHSRAVSPWGPRRFVAGLLSQSVKDETQTETSVGIEFSGAIRDEHDWLDDEAPERLRGRYRLGVARHEYTVPGTLFATGLPAATELTLVTFGFGWDYAFFRRRLSPFVSADVIGVLPFRDNDIPGREDKFRPGLAAGGGIVTPVILARVEFQWLEGDSDIVTGGVGVRF